MILKGKTNIGLVEWAKFMLGHPYWYGCYCQISDLSLYNYKKRQYPKYYNWWRLKSNQLGVRVTDCVGLIKGYLWCKDIYSQPVYNKAQDVSAEGMYNISLVKGSISSMPDIPGILVYKSGHVGVYIGDNTVIEAKGHSWGVVPSSIHSGWTRWSKCPFIDYITETDDKPIKPIKKYYKTYSGNEKNKYIIDKVFSNIGVPAKYRGNYQKRKPVAVKNGIKNYTGTAEENIKLCKLAHKGKLEKV